MRKFAPLLVTAIVVLFTVVAPVVASGGFGSNASADDLDLGIFTPKTLQWLGQHCNDYDDDTPPGVYGSCKATEAALQGDGSLDCPDMFYTPTNPEDDSDKLNVWYTQKTAFAQCYVLAIQKLDFISTSDECASMVKDSPNWNTCDDAEDALHSAIGCQNDDEKGGLFKQEDDHWVINQTSVKACRAKINAVGAVVLKTPPWLKPVNTQTAKQIATDLGLLDKKGNPTGATLDDSGSGSTGDDDQQLACESHAFGFGWVICGVIDMLTNIVEKVDGIITNQLSVETNNIFCENKDTCQAYYTAWQSFRNIALGILVIAVLIAVISEALDMEIINAYTIRKALPRVLIAAVAMTLSWSLMQFAVQLSNDLGFGVRHLIYAPFASINGTIDINFTQSIGTYFFGVVGYLFVGAAGIFMYVLTAVLAIFVAIVVLMLRQILIILMVILAPVAIVAYILPNTQRYYKLWWESFVKALLMFPLIAGMIATGRVFSAIALSTGSGGLTQLLGFVAYFAPYFMIPMTFKMSGAAMGALGGAIQSRADKGFAGLSKRRGDIMSKRFKAARAGGIYRGSNKLTRALNKIGDYTLDADERLAVDIGEGRGVGRLTGRLGKKLLGGQAAEMSEQIAGAANEHTAKATQKLGMHYSAGWAGIGLLDSEHAGAGLSAAGLAELDKHYALKDDDGNIMRNADGTAVGYRGLNNADFGDVERLGHILSTHGADGSMAQLAGTELLNNSGELSRFGLHEETKRASTQSVLALTAASQGKLSGRDIAKRRNDRVKNAGEKTEELVADAEMAQLMRASEPKRADLRRGHGIKKDAKGSAYSVYSSKKVAVDKDNPEVLTEAFKTKGARTAIMTANDQIIGASKGEYFKETLDAYKYHGTQTEKNADGSVKKDARGNPVYTKEAKEIRKQFAKLVGPWGYNDPGAKIEAQAVLEEMQMSDAELTSLQGGGSDGENAEGAEQGRRGGGSSGDTPGAPTPPVPSGGIPGVPPSPL